MEVLGINPVLLIAQVISFGVLFFVLQKFLYKKLRQSLEERRKAVANTLAKEAEAVKRLEKMAADQKKQQQESQAQARALLAEAKKATEEMRKTLLSQAEEKSHQIVEEATARIEQEKQQAEEELKTHVTVLAANLAKQILGEKVATPAGRKKDLAATLSALKKTVKGKK